MNDLILNIGQYGEIKRVNRSAASMVVGTDVMETQINMHTG